MNIIIKVNSAFDVMNKPQTSIETGYDIVDVLVKKWNSQPNPPRVYVSNNRIHHGFLGFNSTTIGFIGLFVSTLLDDKKTRDMIANISGLLIGGGVRLMEDDIEDMHDWFNFENNSSTKPQFQTAYVKPLQFHPTTILSAGQSTKPVQP